MTRNVESNLFILGIDAGHFGEIRPPHAKRVRRRARLRGPSLLTANGTTISLALVYGGQPSLQCSTRLALQYEINRGEDFVTACA